MKHTVNVTHIQTFVREGSVVIHLPEDWSGDEFEWADLVDEATDDADLNAWPLKSDEIHRDWSCDTIRVERGGAVIQLKNEQNDA